MSTSEERVQCSSRRRKRQTDQGFTPIFFDELNITKEVEMMCEGSLPCIFDFLVTGNMDVAMDALEHVRETNVTMDTISKEIMPFLLL